MRNPAVVLPCCCLAAALACAPAADREPAADEASPASGELGVLLGEPVDLGGGSARTYVELDSVGVPTVVGIAFTGGMLEDLPTEPDGTMACFDANGDGDVDPREECLPGVQRDLPMPEGSPAGLPFRWVGLNWNPVGHLAPAPPSYAESHFDFHFYLADRRTIAAIRPGACGFMVDCDVFELARMPVPERYMPQGYVEVGAVAAGEGNHLLDPTSPELQEPPARFTQTFIYGSLGGHIIFYEPMITAAFLAGRPDECHPIKLPEAWEVGGYYPTEYCMRYLPEEAEYRVSLEGLVRREGT